MINKLEPEVITLSFSFVFFSCAFSEKYLSFHFRFFSTLFNENNTLILRSLLSSLLFDKTTDSKLNKCNLNVFLQIWNKRFIPCSPGKSELGKCSV